MDYRFDAFKWLATMDGFNYPVDVYYGTVYLGTIEAKPDGFTIKIVDTPTGKQSIKQSNKNKFRSQNLAAKILHRTWKVLRSGSQHDQVEEPA